MCSNSCNIFGMCAIRILSTLMCCCVENVSESFVVEDEVVNTEETILDLAPEDDSRVTRALEFHVVPQKIAVKIAKIMQFFSEKNALNFHENCAKMVIFHLLHK